MLGDFKFKLHETLYLLEGDEKLVYTAKRNDNNYTISWVEDDGSYDSIEYSHEEVENALKENYWIVIDYRKGLVYF